MSCETASRCAACPVPAASPCHGPCVWASSGDPFLVKSVVDRAAMPPPGAPPPPRPASAPGVLPPGALALRAYRTSWTGYGTIAGRLGRQLDRLGVPFGFVDHGTDARYLPVDPWVQARTCPAPPPGRNWTLRCTVPSLGSLADSAPSVVFSMWESTRISRDAAACLNAAERVVVPCRWNADGFRASGVTAPIAVVPLGVDPLVYAERPFPEGRPFTFGMSARMAHGGLRKNLNDGIRAFLRAFDRGQDVRLELKVFDDCLEKLDLPDDPRVRVVTRPLTAPGMADWFAGLDCLFVPSRGEGWGLNTVEAMAVGRPVVAAVYGGTAEFFDASCGWALPFAEEPAGEFYDGQGDWCVPDEDGMVEALRAAERDPDACRAKGAAAGRRAAEFPWDRTGDELVAVLRDAGAVPRPRPACSYREACGCQTPRCLHRERGARFGARAEEASADGSSVTAYRVTDAACAACGGVA